MSARSRHVRAIRNPQSAIPNAFTLLEVMFAIMILGVGLLGIAALLPAAGSLQRESSNDVMGMYVAASAENYLKAVGFDESAISSLSADTIHDPGTIPGLLPHAKDRSFPTTIDDETKRQWYWYPLIRKDSSKGWQVFIVVMHRPDGGGVPVPAKNVTTVAGDLYVTNAGEVERKTTDGAIGGSNWGVAAQGTVIVTRQISGLGSEVIR